MCRKERFRFKVINVLNSIKVVKKIPFQLSTSYMGPVIVPVFAFWTIIRCCWVVYFAQSHCLTFFKPIAFLVCIVQPRVTPWCCQCPPHSPPQLLHTFNSAVGLCQLCAMGERTPGVGGGVVSTHWSVVELIPNSSLSFSVGI